MTPLPDLPDEVLELVFSQIPLYELLMATSLVCKRWRNIISRELFLTHKKNYHRYRLGDPDTISRLDEMVKCQVDLVELRGETVLEQIKRTGTRLKTAQLERCLPWLVQLFSSQDLEYSIDKNCEDIFSAVSNHTRYSLASDLLEERFPSVLNCNSTVVIVLLIVTARDVYDVRELIKVCVAQNSPAKAVQVTEVLHLVATYLLVFQSMYNFPPRHHYILHYALFLHETQWTYDPSSQFVPRNVQLFQPKLARTVNLTTEQKKIVNMDLDRLIGTTNTVRIMAYAGTGKTTTLVELCARNPRVKFLLVVFNKSVKEHSSSVFPRNVIVKTANSLSWQYIVDTEGRERIAPWGLKYTDLINKNLLPHRPNFGKFSLYHRAAMVMETLTSFFNSCQHQAGLEHSPEEWVTSKTQPPVKLTEKQRKMLVTDAEEVWDTIRRGRMRQVKHDQDSAMKKFQLADPNLEKFVGNYDVLLIDEAQDMNPAMLDVCLKQGKPKIVVGDSHQQIYSFRGAVNALDLVADHESTEVIQTLYLTQSFRFGPEIAFLANSCLEHMVRTPGDIGPLLIGSSKQDNIIKPGVGGEKIAVIGRTNLGIFEKMVELVCLAEDRPRIALPVDISGYNQDPMGWEILVDFSHWQSGNMEFMSEKARNNPNYKNKTWEQFVKQVEEGRDNETLAKIGIVKKFGSKIPEYVDILWSCLSNSMKDPAVVYVFSTVHKFKGLESDTVWLLDDFFYEGIPVERPGLWRQSNPEDEYNLLYVALTRAKKTLLINDALFYLLTSSFLSCSFEYVVRSNLISSGSHCVKCKADLDFNQVAVLHQEEIRVSGNWARKEGYLCLMCGWNNKRKINYKIGGHGEIQPDMAPVWKVKPGVVSDGNRSFYNCLVGPISSSAELDRKMILHMDDMEMSIKQDLEITVVCEDAKKDPITDFFEDDDEDFLDFINKADDEGSGEEEDSDEEEEEPQTKKQEVEGGDRGRGRGRGGNKSGDEDSDEEEESDEEEHEPQTKKQKVEGGNIGRGRGRVGDRGGSQGVASNCFKCGEGGHFSRECPKGGGRNLCFNCQEEGHMSRECTKPKIPRGGGDRGGRDGRGGDRGPGGRGSRGGRGSGGCFKCGVDGHFSRECPKFGGGGGRDSGGCFKCGEYGHFSRECPKGGRGGGGGGLVKCYNCEGEGHKSRECPEPSNRVRGGGSGTKSRGGGDRDRGTPVENSFDDDDEALLHALAPS